MERINGYELNEPYDPEDWSQREFNLLSAFAGLMPACGSRVVSAGEHFHNILTNQNGVSALFVTSEGKVGIGDTDPSEKLTVSGAIKATGDIYTTTWQPYTPEQFGGFSDTTTSAFKYKEIGDLVFVKYDVFGTGNYDATYFSLPVSADEAGVMPIGFAGVTDELNSDVQAQGMRIMPSDTKLVYVGWNVWGEGNPKEYCGNFWYRKKV